MGKSKITKLTKNGGIGMDIVTYKFVVEVVVRTQVGVWVFRK
jgi:hypothetical protein